MTTADYPEKIRKDLGVAVTRAREAAGWLRRVDFAEAAKISLRSLAKLEQGAAGVGRKVLEAVGRTLPGWDEDTPYSILDGTPPPPTTLPVDAGQADPIDELSERERERFLVARDFMRTQGRYLDVQAWRDMGERYDERMGTYQSRKGNHRE